MLHAWPTTWSTSVWIVGGDGWAYDIGYGGLDHVLASGRNVNVLVLDTEVYSNTGGQASKSTPMGAGAKFAAGRQAHAEEGPGHDRHVPYGGIYVAKVAWLPRRPDVKAFRKPESFTAPAHPPTATASPTATTWPTAATSRSWRDSGHWPLFRFDPAA